MDTKNVIAAISLSAAVIILYSLFFAPAVVDKKDISNKISNNKKMGRNEPCFCGSGKKFKHCHGAL